MPPVKKSKRSGRAAATGSTLAPTHRPTSAPTHRPTATLICAIPTFVSKPMRDRVAEKFMQHNVSVVPSESEKRFVLMQMFQEGMIDLHKQADTDAKARALIQHVLKTIRADPSMSDTTAEDEFLTIHGESMQLNRLYRVVQDIQGWQLSRPAPGLTSDEKLEAMEATAVALEQKVALIESCVEHYKQLAHRIDQDHTRMYSRYGTAPQGADNSFKDEDDDGDVIFDNQDALRMT